MNETTKTALVALLAGELRRAAARALTAGVTPAAIHETLEQRQRLLQRRPDSTGGGAMRTKTALQLADGTGWHYANSGRSGAGHPIGRCASHPPHPTEAEARDCYGAFLREDTIRLDAGKVGWTSCQARHVPAGTVGHTSATGRPAGTPCPNPTQSYATYGDDGYGQVSLCPDHMTVDDVITAAGLAGPAGDSWVS